MSNANGILVYLKFLTEKFNCIKIAIGPLRENQKPFRELLT